MTKLEFLPTADFLYLDSILFFPLSHKFFILQEKGTILVFPLIHDNFNLHNAMSPMKKEIFMTKEHSSGLCRVSRSSTFFVPGTQCRNLTI